jgi:hypothetical protein
MIVSGYLLALYCDNEKAHPNGWLDEIRQFPIEFSCDGKNSFSNARKMARQSGWKLNLDGTCLCPKCNSTNKTNP